MSAKYFVDPVHCFHERLKYQEFDGNMNLVCLDCVLESATIKIGWSRSFARSRASRLFYRLANIVDKRIKK